MKKTVTRREIEQFLRDSLRTRESGNLDKLIRNNLVGKTIAFNAPLVEFGWHIENANSESLAGLARKHYTSATSSH